MTKDDTLSTLLPPGLLARLMALAARSGRPPEDCLVQAVSEYCDTWEDYHRMVDHLVLNEDERRTLRVVNE
ncbi:ribbon-helix-helix protein, CopG family [Roseospira goensis]|uniref:Putative DNA-binding protein n=1 Tax=Roseospira goensis TaxID=391922 RepID=A0A7W6WL15_9PROT|nr:putative DNA-binding protein [Roseospira goensis]